MTTSTNAWFTLTPAGAIRAFGRAEPDRVAQQLQVLLSGEHTLDLTRWTELSDVDDADVARHEASAWVQRLPRPLQGPDAKLDDFLQFVIAGLSAERRVVLASDSGFCLGRAGFEQDEADVLSAAAADYGAFAERQARRGWGGAGAYVAFHADPHFLLPTFAFVPLWVDGTGYWLIMAGEPLLNCPALVELLWGLKVAGTRFAAGS